MTEDFGHRCARTGCPNLAVRQVRWERERGGEWEIVAADLCEAHAVEQEGRLCQRDGCIRYAEVVIGLDGTDDATGLPRQDELRICRHCWDLMQTAPSVTINGITMVHDGSGRMQALPKDIGRG
jgi:hypothetical protein